MKFVIIGNSAAGVGAIEAIRRCDNESEITVISNENAPIYSRCLLSYIIQGSKDLEGIRFRPDNFYKQMKVKPVLGTVTAVVPEEKRISLDDGFSYSYHKLLIATGSTPKMPGDIPKGLKNTFVLRTIEQAKDIKTAAQNAKHAVVLGGGLVGLKAAFALKKRGLNTAVMVRSAHVLSQMADFEAAQIVQKILAQEKITVLTGAGVVKVESRDRMVTGLIYEKDKTEQSIPCDLLLVAKGVTANTGLIQDTTIKKHWGILTDAKMRSSDENIYAAGDVAETFDVATESRNVNALWTCAVQQGRIAGLNMAGQDRVYDGSVGMNSISFPGIDLISFGIVRHREDKDYEIMVDHRPKENVYKKVVLKENKIKGLVLVNKIDNAGVLLSLLGRKMDVSDFKSDLLSDRFSYANILGSRGHNELLRYWYAGRSV